MRPTIRIALLSFVVGCSEASGPSELALVMSVNPTTVLRSDSIVVLLDVYNRSSRTVEVPSPDAFGFCNHVYMVTSDSGAEVAVPTGLCAAISPGPIALAPGQRITIEDYWLPGQSTLNGAPLPSGVYRLRARIHAEGEEFLSGVVQITLTQ